MHKTLIVFLISFIAGFVFFTLRSAPSQSSLAENVSPQRSASSAHTAPLLDEKNAPTWAALSAKSKTGYLRMCAALADDLDGLSEEQIHKLIDEGRYHGAPKARNLQRLLSNRLKRLEQKEVKADVNPVRNLLSQLWPFWEKKGPLSTMLEQALAPPYQQHQNVGLVGGHPEIPAKVRPVSPDVNASSQELLEYSQQLLQFDWREAVDWLRSETSDQLDTQSARDIIEQWKTKDPAAAATFLADRQDLISSVFVAGELAEGFAKVAPAAATEWAGKLKNREYRAYAMGNAIGAWAAIEPEAAIAFATGLNDQAFRQETYDSIFAAAILQNPQGGLDLLDRFPASDQPAAVKTAVKKLAEYFPNIAAKELELRADQLENQTAAGEIATTIAKSWAGADSLAALKWAANLENPTLREKASAAGLEAWAETDALGASEYIRTIEDKGLREQAAASLAEKAAFIDPESALEWASSIEDPELRGRTLHRIGSEWKESSPTRAREAILSLEIPDARRIKIEKMFE